jgi:hypothetical protein
MIGICNQAIFMEISMIHFSSGSTKGRVVILGIWRLTSGRNGWASGHSCLLR